MPVRLNNFEVTGAPQSPSCGLRDINSCGLCSAYYNSNLWKNQQIRKMKTKLPILMAAALVLFGFWIAGRIPPLQGDDKGASSNSGLNGEVQGEIDGAADGLEPSDAPLYDPSRSGQEEANNSENNSSSSASSGNLLMAKAVGILKEHPSISAKIRHKVDLYNHQLLGTGRYLQETKSSNIPSDGPPKVMFRLELQLAAGDQTFSFLQIADINYMYIVRNPDVEKQGIVSVDMGQLRKALAKAGPVTPRGTMLSNFAPGGLPALVGSLADNFNFGEPRVGNLGNLRVWMIEGTWREEQLASFFPDSQLGAKIDATRLPAPIPHRVKIVLGQDDLFPYRIEYLRTKTASLAESGSATPPDHAMVVMELIEVRIGDYIDPKRFIYDIGDQGVPRDRTEHYLRRMGLVEEYSDAG